MRNRKNDVKREHHVLDGLIPILEKITSLSYVKSIVPGRIKPISGSYPKPKLEYKTKTLSGIKCLAKADRATQEVFIVTTAPEELIEYLRNVTEIQ